mmetsp:Transcript_69132/g.182621  ORF Transcript_69132/g.182621 Transcript_69132/m.182621 type:complete len:88 (-) Transcript_69132:407-670(-)
MSGELPPMEIGDEYNWWEVPPEDHSTCKTTVVPALKAELLKEKAVENMHGASLSGKPVADRSVQVIETVIFLPRGVSTPPVTCRKFE